MIFDLATSRHGSGTLTGTGYMLDSAQNVAPFTNSGPPTIQTMKNPLLGNLVARIDTTMDDHPYCQQHDIYRFGVCAVVGALGLQSHTQSVAYQLFQSQYSPSHYFGR